jgi:hypothetical protein
MDRRPTTQDITWLLDLDRNNQLDLDPPYQRRSVWTRKDRQFFLDTIFRNFPSPAIFLHKSMNEDGAATYHVVDGKQRLQTILHFVRGELRIAKDYGDIRLDGKKWEELVGDTELKHRFWNYQVTVEMLDEQQVAMVRDVFDRLNRNARRLTRQELRHAKFDGWLIGAAEDDSEREEWKELGITTRARSARMTDTQFISELMLVVLENKVLGFDQDVSMASMPNMTIRTTSWKISRRTIFGTGTNVQKAPCSQWSGRETWSRGGLRGLVLFTVYGLLLHSTRVATLMPQLSRGDTAPSWNRLMSWPVREIWNPS